MKKSVTLVEVMIAATILAVALIPLLRLITTLLQRSTDLQKKTVSAQLAQDLMSDILSRRWDENADATGYTPDGPPPLGEPDLRSTIGPDGESSKNSFDDIDDFNGYSDGRGTSIPIQDSSGKTLPEYRFFLRSVTVSYCDINGTATASKTNYKIITVTVQDDKGNTTQINQIVPNVQK